MMKNKTRYGWIVVAGLLVGCGGKRTPVPTPLAPTPLSVAEWRELPVSEKYDEATFDRLKLHEPKLKDDRNWAWFMAKTIIPERKKDLPGDLPN